MSSSIKRILEMQMSVLCGLSERTHIKSLYITYSNYVSHVPFWPSLLPLGCNLLDKAASCLQIRGTQFRVAAGTEQIFVKGPEGRDPTILLQDVSVHLFCWVSNMFTQVLYC